MLDDLCGGWSAGVQRHNLNARDHILSLQADEDEGLTTDISNMQFALEALRASEEFKPCGEFAGEVEYRGNVEQEVTESSNKELFREEAILFLQSRQKKKGTTILSGKK